MPREPRTVQTYAPAAPFAEAILEWCAQRDARLRAQLRTGLVYVPPNHRTPGLVVLSHRSGIPTRTLRRYLSGASQLIVLRNADRLSLAIDVPLVMLAEEFLPFGEAQARWCSEGVAA